MTSKIKAGVKGPRPAAKLQKLGKFRDKSSSKKKSPYECGLCDYTTNHCGHLAYHITLHTGERPYKCQHLNCTAAFASKGNLKNHSQTHTTDKPFSCNLCPYTARRYEHLNNHHRTVHSTERRFKCPQPGCAYASKAKRSMTRHVVIHSTDKPFACSFVGCVYKSKWKDVLKEHERLHVGVKKFKCSLCSFATVSRNGIIYHTRVHTGESPYPCPHCSYRAKAYGRLKAHVRRIHSGEKSTAQAQTSSPSAFISVVPSRNEELECKVVKCGFSTAKDVTLTIHLNTVHNLPRVTLKKLQL